MPMKPTDAIHAVWLGWRLHCAASDARMNEMSPTSIASSAHPSPEPVSTRRCTRVKGSRSRRSERVSDALVPASFIATSYGCRVFGGRSGEHVAHERRDLRAVELDRAHHLLVRERAGRELHVEPLDAERPD